MELRNKFWWFVGVTLGIGCLILSGLVAFSWQQLSAEEQLLLFDITKRNIVYIFSAFILIAAGLGSALDAISHLYILPMGKLIEETHLINAINPSHRIKIEGSRNILKLAQIINEGADQTELLQNNIQATIDQVRSEAESEKNILAAIMAELPEGILICNRDGRILLYNTQAKQILNTEDSIKDNDASEKDNIKANLTEDTFIGLGRSVFSVIDKNLVVHAIDEITDKLNRKDKNVISSSVAVGKAKNLLRVDAVPILNQEHIFTGFILILNDITRQLEIDSCVGLLLQNLTIGIRNALAGIRTAIETIIDYPEMDQKTRYDFNHIIKKGAISIGNDLDHISLAYLGYLKNRWPLIQMPAKDLFKGLKVNAESKLGISLHIEDLDNTHWIRADSYSLMLVMLFALHQLKKETGNSAYLSNLERTGDVINFDVIWQGTPIRIDTLRAWDEKILMIKKEGLPLTLKEVLRHHDAELWSYACRRQAGRAYLRLFLPAYDPSGYEPVKKPAVVTQSRPEFYDFDLFNQRTQSVQLDNRPLRGLTFTVFDTETTGLNPRGGDEILSIGAVRIVNNRILGEEIFDRLVNPQRPVSKESVKIHGIDPALLVTKPTIDIILPLFHRFSEDTVLVAHNAAFDMCMLQLKEKTTGIKFLNPVLDTLLLSAIVHPAHGNHSLEAISERIGVRVVGRHTALGDAMATAEILLKLIPLLEKKGIVTLAQARRFSRKTYYARLKY